MNKFLRYSFVVLMAMFMGNAFAEEFKVTFKDCGGSSDDGTKQTEISGIVSEGASIFSAVEESSDIYQAREGRGIKLGTGKRPGSLILKLSSPIKVSTIKFTARKYNDTETAITVNGKDFTELDGNFNEYTVELNGSEVDKISITTPEKRAYITTMTIIGEVIEYTPDEPSDNPFEKYNISSGSITEKDGQVIVDFKGTNQNQEITGNMVFEFGENKLCTKCTVVVTFPTEELAQAAYNAAMGDDEPATIDGKTVSVILTKDVSMMSKILVKSMMKMLIDGEKSGLGTSLEDLMTPNQANVLGGILQKDAASDMDFYIKGKIAKIKYEFSAQYGTATFFISADGNNDYTFQCYSVYYLENKPWVEGNTQIKVGDEVIICGKIVNYQGNTPETVSKQAYIYSLNGVTKNEGGENPQPSDEVKKVTVADFNAAAESDDVWYQLTGIVKNLKDDDIYGNFDLEDETGSVYVYGLLSEKGGEKKKFQELAAAKGIKNGCKLTIIGTRGSYNGKIEVMNAYFVSVEPGSITPDDPKDPETDKGTLEKPFTPAEANEFVAKLGDNESVNDYYIKGKIIEITDKNQFSTQYGNCTFYISDDGTDKADKFYVFRTLYLGNVKYTEGILPKAGDEVIICGKLVNYKGNTPETVQNKSYIYSLNGETTGIANTLIDEADAPLFNLAGQRVDASYKGVVIKNGKKMLQK